MRSWLILSLFVACAVWCLPQDAQAQRARCYAKCKRMYPCTYTKRYFTRRYCQPRRFCRWRYQCRESIFGERLCRRRYVCKRRRRCTYRRYSRSVRTCRAKMLCFRRCLRIPIGTRGRGDEGEGDELDDSPDRQFLRNRRTYRERSNTRQRYENRYKAPRGNERYKQPRGKERYKRKGYRGYPPTRRPIRTVPVSHNSGGTVPPRRNDNRGGETGDNMELFFDQKGQMRRVKLPPPRKAPVSKETLEQRKRLRTLKEQLAKRKAELERLRNMTQKQQDRLKKLKSLSAKERALVEKERANRKKLQQERFAELATIKKQREAEQRRLKRIQQRASKMQRLAQREKHLAIQRRKLAKLRLIALKKKHSKQLQMLKEQESKLAKRMHTIRRRKKRIKRERSTESQAQVAFNKGKLKTALAIFSKNGNKKMAHMVKDFRAAYYAGSRESRNRNASSAIPHLEKAHMLDLELGGGKSIYTKRVRAMLGNMHIYRGLLAMSRRSYESAYVYFNVAKRYTPRHRSIRSKLKELRKQAKKYFAQGKANTKQPRIARRYLQKVIRLVPPDDKLYRRARTLLTSIQ